MPDKPDQSKLLQSKTEELVARMERLNLAEYVEMLRDPKRLLWTNFLAGTARGVGMAVGFTLLSALVVYFLQHLVRFKSSRN